MRKLINTVLAGALGLSMIAGVSAADGDAIIQVNPKEGTTVAVEITNAEFIAVDYSLVAQTTSSDIVITVTDDSGKAEGWTIQLSGTRFETNPVNETSFDIENLTLGTGDVQPYEDGNYPTSNISSVGLGNGMTVSGDSQSVVTAPEGSGTGKFVITFVNSSLNVPGGTLVGDYTSTLTVTVAGEEPGGDD